MLKYREWLNDISRSVKLNYYCNMLGIDHSNLSKFLNGNDKVLKIEKVELLINFIRNDLTNLIQKDA